jgi:hypothetical protein
LTNIHTVDTLPVEECIEGDGGHIQDTIEISRAMATGRARLNPVADVESQRPSAIAESLGNEVYPLKAVERHVALKLGLHVGVWLEGVDRCLIGRILAGEQGEVSAVRTRINDDLGAADEVRPPAGKRQSPDTVKQDIRLEQIAGVKRHLKFADGHLARPWTREKRGKQSPKLVWQRHPDVPETQPARVGFSQNK